MRAGVSVQGKVKEKKEGFDGRHSFLERKSLSTTREKKLDSGPQYDGS